MKEILMLVKFAERRLELNSADEIYCSNLIAEETGESAPLSVSTPVECESYSSDSPEELLKRIFKKAVENGKCGEGEYEEFFCRIMDILTPRPSEVRAGFYKRYKQNKRSAFEYYHALSVSSCYIKKEAVSRNIKWISDNTEKPLEITINLSKPEKNNIETAARLKAPASYPKCAICAENEGYTGNGTFRRNLRIVPVKLNGEDWFIQYSPYAYFDEHLIAVNRKHTPMKISEDTILKLLDFTDFAPFYFIGCNACLPIVGGSILSHDHFQGGHYTFAMAKAPVEEKIVFKGFENVDAGIVKWPMSVIRLSHKDYHRIIELADVILAKWRGYTDEAAFIYAETDGEPHNTITPIARKRGDNYELDLVLRNNITTEEHPLGVYHPHAELHHIKKENIGLIEVMGLAVLPSRLKGELEQLAKAIVAGEDIRKDEVLEKHADWVDEFLPKYAGQVNEDTIMDILQKEVGIVFGKVLEHAGVYKRNAEGAAAFDRFINALDERN